MMIHSLQKHARRVLAHSSNVARLFCSNTNKTLSTSNQTLQIRINSALHQNSKISTVLEQWRQQGNELNPSMVRGIFEKLRDSKQYSQALEVSTWMAERKICSLVPEDYTSRFHLFEKVLGFKEAGKLLEKVPEILRNESMSEKKDLDIAEGVFKKMRELDLLLKPSPYSSMMSLYIFVGNRGKVDEILREMKENNVEVDNLGVAKAYLRVGSKREAREMLVSAEELDDPASYKELMRLYGEAGKSEDVYRIWNLYKKTGKQDNDGFLALIGSLLNLDDTKGAEEMYDNEYECSGLEFDVRIPTMLVSGFRKKGMIQQADILMNKTVRNIRLDDDKPFTPILQQEWGNEEYVSVVKPLLKLGDVKGSQETYGEWKQASGGGRGGGGGGEKGGEMKMLIGEKIKMFMQILGGVVMIIFLVIGLLMVSYVAATDPLLAVIALTAAVLCSCACPFCLLFLLFSPSRRTDSQ